jgi:hypothetical protein
VKCGLKGLYECFGTSEGWRMGRNRKWDFTVEWRAFADPSKPAKIFYPCKKCRNEK